MVTKLLFDADRKVTFGEDGSPLFSIRRAPATGMPEEDMQLPLTDGVGAWLKSDEAKMFLPAPGATIENGIRRQTVATRTTKVGNDGMPHYEGAATTDDERVRRAAERAQALAAKYPGQFDDNF
jgi:hypothetical protein